LYLEEEDYESLRKSIDSFKNFNMISLAQKISAHELLEFSKKDRMWKDCIDTANESADGEIIEGLLRFFCETSEKECFCAALYTCFSHISPDVVLELAWLNGYQNFVMPFLIQNLRQTHTRLRELETKTADPKESENIQDGVAATYGGLSGFGGGMLMLENGGGSFAPPMMGGGMGGPDMSGFVGASGFQNGMPNGGMPANGGMYMGM
jgi:clathrin heavy chain